MHQTQALLLMLVVVIAGIDAQHFDWLEAPDKQLLDTAVKPGFGTRWEWLQAHSLWQACHQSTSKQASLLLSSLHCV